MRARFVPACVCAFAFRVEKTDVYESAGVYRNCKADLVVRLFLDQSPHLTNFYFPRL